MTHFRLGLAMICTNCESVFSVQPTCPACGSDAIYPIEHFFRARDGRAHERATVAELVRLRVLKSA